MFGTLRPAKLDGCSQSCYQSSFCGSCHSMAALGRSLSLTTSYDIAFLHLVIAGLEEAPTESLPCTVLPFKKVAVRKLSENSQRWLAAINVLLIEAKCQDDVADEGSWKGKLGVRLLSRQAKDARSVLLEFAFPVHLLSELPIRQARLERGSQPTLEGLAKPTSEVLGEIFGFVAGLTERPERRVALRQLGQGLGAAIYIKDAIEDLDADKRRSRFNALQRSGRDADTRYARAALTREIQRAKQGLSALQLGPENDSLQAIFDSLTPADLDVMEPAAASRFRRRTAQRGILDCGFGPYLAGCALWLLFDGCCHLSCGTCVNGKPTCAVDESSAGKSKTTLEARASPVKALACPACESPLVKLTYGSVEFDECSGCLGVWLDHGELEQLAALDYVPPRLLTSQVGEAVQLRPEGTRSCPVCAEFLNVMTVKDVRIDACPKCRGLWLDQGELNVLLDSADSSG